MKFHSFGNPTDDAKFLVLCHIAKRQQWFQRLLWQRLRSIMAEGRRDQGGDWSARYLKLLERAARHQRRIDRGSQSTYEWINSRTWGPQRPNLQLVRGAK